MISDVHIRATVEELRRYQREFPQCYDGLRLEINQVIIAMDALRAKLRYGLLAEIEMRAVTGNVSTMSPRPQIM